MVLLNPSLKEPNEPKELNKLHPTKHITEYRLAFVGA